MVRVTLAAVAALAALALSACGSSSESASSGGGSPSTATTTSGGATFPVTVTHKFGSTTVPSTPKRIVSVGFTEQDTILELGYTPIAVTEWYNNEPSATWPWARPLLGDAKPTVLHADDGFDFEKIAALHPDLIIGTNAGMKRKDYDKLSALAPTIAPVTGSTDYFSRWDQQTVQIAEALGKAAAGRKLVADVKAQYAKAAAEHPEFRGKLATFSQNAFYDGKLYVYPPGLNTEFLTYLGFTINPKLAKLAPAAGAQAEVSAEQLPVIDADVLVFATEKPSDVTNLEKVPTFGRLKAVAGHRAVFSDATLAGAMYFMTPLALKYTLDHLVPQLATAVAGQAPRKVLAAG